MNWNTYTDEQKVAIIEDRLEAMWREIHRIQGMNKVLEIWIRSLAL